jgi:pimeloyl-ACP methyl ester carboxylesterase
MTHSRATSYRLARTWQNASVGHEAAGIGTATVERDGLVFDVTTAGPVDGDPVVLLHGFPQSARCWDAVTPALAAAGFRTMAPDQRGYSPGARPVGRAAYRTAELVADAVAFVEAALAETGRPGAHVVGHDWGSLVAWGLAGSRPELLHTVTGISVPPPGAMSAALHRPRQLLASWYMAAFAVPGLAERAFAVPAGRLWSPGLVRMLVRSGQTRERAERDAARLADPAALTAALNWYRAIPLSRREAIPHATVPALFVWSDRDTALTRDAAEEAARHVDGPFRYAELRGVSHWIPDEAPAALTELLLEHIGAR